MRKRLFAAAAGLIMALGIAASATPAPAADGTCTAEVAVSGYGGVTVCFNLGTFTDVTLQQEVRFAWWSVTLHDWTYDGHAIFVEYQPWGSTAWYTVVSDLEGGPATYSGHVQNGDVGIPIRYMRVRTEGSGAYRYIFKPTSGAGSGNGCGLWGWNGCSY